MKSVFTHRLETYVGVALLLIAVVGFLFSVLTAFPSKDQVASQAKPLKFIPRDLFSSDNEVNKTIRGLNTPAGVPVTVNPENLGRTNVFQNF